MIINDLNKRYDKIYVITAPYINELKTTLYHKKQLVGEYRFLNDEEILSISNESDVGNLSADAMLSILNSYLILENVYVYNSLNDYTKIKGNHNFGRKLFITNRDKLESKPVFYFKTKSNTGTKLYFDNIEIAIASKIYLTSVLKEHSLQEFEESIENLHQLFKPLKSLESIEEIRNQYAEYLI